jgi:hypothetical protein
MVSTMRFGQSCARAAGASVTSTAHAAALHAVRNDIESSLDYRSSNRLRWPCRRAAHLRAMLRLRAILRFRRRSALPAA